MKTWSPLAVCVFSLVSHIVRAQGAEWATLIDGAFTESIYALCRDPEGNVYSTGRMSNGTVGTVWVDISGTYDIYLAKFNVQGECQWVASPGGSDLNDLNERDQGWDVLYDTITNSVYLCGTYQAASFNPPAVFGPGISVSGRGSFLARYDTSGSCLWMRASDNGLAHSIAVDGSGAIYVYGYSTDEGGALTTFHGPPPITIVNGPFVAKYTSEGQLLWAKNIGHDVDGKLCVQGDRMYFGGGTYGTDRSFLGMSLPDEPIYIGLLAEVDTSFTMIQWMDLYESSSSASIMDLDITDTGKLLVLGSFQDSLFLPTDTLIQTSDGTGVFFLQSESHGEMLWSTDLAIEALYARSLSTAPDGSSYVGFAFGGALTLSSGIATAGTERDLALLRFGANGEFIGMVQNGPIGSGRCAVRSMSDNSVVIGYPLTGTIDLGNGHVLSGEADAFVAKLGVITSVQSMSASPSGELLIYANPNHGTCSIELPEALQGENGLTLRILDAQGRVVQQSPLTFEGGTIRLDIRAQAKGTYVAEVSNGKVRYTGRIVFE